MCFESRIQSNMQDSLFADLQAIRGSLDPQTADVFLHGFTNDLAKDPVIVIGRKPNAFRQHIQVKIAFKVRLNMDKRREDRLFIFFIGLKDHSAHAPNYTTQTNPLLDFSCYFILWESTTSEHVTSPWLIQMIGMSVCPSPSGRG